MINVNSGHVCPVIDLGRYDEHLVASISFDISPWVERHGEGVVELTHQRCGDEAPYPVVVERS